MPLNFQTLENNTDVSRDHGKSKMPLGALSEIISDHLHIRDCQIHQENSIDTYIIAHVFIYRVYISIYIYIYSNLHYTYILYTNTIELYVVSI